MSRGLDRQEFMPAPHPPGAGGKVFAAQVLAGQIQVILGQQRRIAIGAKGVYLARRINFAAA